MITHELIDPADYTLFVWRPFYLQSHYFLANNLDLWVHGKPLVTYDPLSLWVTNVVFDFDYAMSGWVMEIGCNYPEA